MIAARRLLRDVDPEAFDITLALYVGYFFTQCRAARAADLAPPPRPPALAGRGLLGLAGRAPGLVVTAPRAVGVRLPYDGVPAAVRAWVDADARLAGRRGRRAGGRDVARLRHPADLRRRDPRLRQGRRRRLNPDTPGLFRREVGVLEHLGEHPLWARLLASYDDGDWVALLIEDVEGRTPTSATTRSWERSSTATDQLSEVLQGA